MSYKWGQNSLILGYMSMFVSREISLVIPLLPYSIDLTESLLFFQEGVVINNSFNFNYSDNYNSTLLCVITSFTYLSIRTNRKIFYVCSVYVYSVCWKIRFSLTSCQNTGLDYEPGRPSWSAVKKETLPGLLLLMLHRRQQRKWIQPQGNKTVYQFGQLSLCFGW